MNSNRRDNPNNYRFCGQIMISHIKKSRGVYHKILELLNKDFDLFGRILQLKVLRTGNRNLRTEQTDTIAFLTYVRNASHWEAIEHYTAKPIFYMEKKLHFRPCSFTNEEYSTNNTNRYRGHFRRLGVFGMPLNGSTDWDNETTRNREANYIRRITANNNTNEAMALNVPVLENQPRSVITDDDTYRCVKCNSIQKFSEYSNHKQACTGFNEIEKKVELFSNFVRHLANDGEDDWILINLLEEKCSICFEYMATCRSREIKTLVCGHRLHLQCYEGLVENGIPCPKQRLEYGEDVRTRLPVTLNVVETQYFRANYTNKAYICPLCRTVGTKYLLNFSNANRRWSFGDLDDIIEVDNGY